MLFAEVSSQAQLAELRAQVEHWQGVATICELSKQEELAELQQQCDQEIQSLQEALRGQCAISALRLSCGILCLVWVKELKPHDVTLGLTCPSANRLSIKRSSTMEEIKLK